MYTRCLFLFLPLEAVKSIATVKLIWVLQKKQTQILLVVVLLCRKINRDGNIICGQTVGH